MTEYMQVPVSLLKGLRDALAEHDDPHCEVNNYASDQAYISHVDALLSQPTPTAERDDLLACLEVGDDGYNRWDTDALDRLLERRMIEPTVAELPRIEGMAPGTTFESDGKRYKVQPDGTLLLLGVGRLPALAVAASSVDTSTIRDVTPPKDAA